jgi:hypothetical protein
MPRVIVKDRIWPGLNYHPHPGQVAVHSSTARNRVHAAGRRTGKSTCGGHELVPEAFKAKANALMLKELGIRMEFWIVGPNYTDAEKEFRVFYNDLRRLQMPMDRPGTYNDTRSGNMQVSLWDGAMIVTAKSAAKPESLVGEGLHGVIMAESAKMKESVWSKYVRPTLADFRGWSLWNSTPEGKNWFHDLYQQGKNPAVPDWESFRTPSWINRFVFRKGMTEFQLRMMKDTRPGFGPALAESLGADPEILSMYYDLGPLLFSQEVECSFTEYAGRVYYDFDEEVHVKDIVYNPDWPTFIATDYGYTNPNVALFIQVGPFGTVHVLGEYYRNMETDAEFAQSVLLDPNLAPLVNAATILYPDPEDPGATAVLRKAWKVGAARGTGGELKNRIRLIRDALKVQNTHLDFGHPDRQPNMFIDRSCKNLLREMDAFRYPDVNTKGTSQENPLKKDDHAPEALSRFFAGYFGTSGSARPRQRRAAFSR